MLDIPELAILKIELSLQSLYVGFQKIYILLDLLLLSFEGGKTNKVIIFTRIVLVISEVIGLIIGTTSHILNLSC